MNRFNVGTITLILMLSIGMTSCATNVISRDGANVDRDSGSIAKVSDVQVVTDGDVMRLSIKADGPISYTVFKLKDPMRLIVDMSQIDLSQFTSDIPVDSGPVSVIRPYYFADSNDSRIEIDLTADVDYSVDDSDPNKIEIMVSAIGGGVAKPMVTAHAHEETTKESAPAPMEPTQFTEEEMAYAHEEDGSGESMTITDLLGGTATVENVSFRQVGKLSRIEIVMSSSSPSYDLISRDRIKRLTIDLPNSVISSENERLINVSLEESVVKNIAVFQFRGGNRPLAKVVVNLTRETLYNIISEGNRIILDVGDEAVIAAAQAVAGEIGAEMTPDTAKYTGAPISLDFQKADIHNILRILADVSGYNVITSDNVKGRVTMKLTNVPWDQALDVILSNNGLDKIMEGNIIRVATLSEIQRENEARKKALEAEKIIAPLHTTIFEINYETAEKMKSNLNSLKSERGKIETNERTNTLIVQDTRAKIAEMANLIKWLDKKEEQVLIEARIVEIAHSKAMELGIQWGGYYNGVSNANFPSTYGVSGTATSGSPNMPLQGGSAVSLPINAAPTGSIGLTLGNVAGTALLDARLMAMEHSGEGRIVSMPKITTMNNNTAIIESGREVPYQTTSTEGTKTEFKKATLSLEVTPHVTPDRNIRMKIEVKKDEVDFANATAAGPPIIKKSAITEVLVANGETTVIGGLFKNSDVVSRGRVPGLGDIPLLGILFRNKATTKESEELLIFITPKIVE